VRNPWKEKDIDEGLKMILLIELKNHVDQSIKGFFWNQMKD